MKVKELLAELQGIDPETEIIFRAMEGCCDDTRDLELADFEASKLADNIFWVGFTFKQLPGYYSCIQTGGTIKAHNDYWKKIKPEFVVKR